MERKSFCLIVGAGLTGLTAARFLQARGWRVVVLEKGRVVGGRMATRRIGASLLDSGAQFFTVRDARFKEAARQWEAAGWIAHWFTHEGHVRFLSKGGMTALAEHLAAPLDVKTRANVKNIEPEGGGWRVTTDSGEIFHPDTLLLTPPAPETAELLTSCAGRLPEGIFGQISGIKYDPCFSLLVTVDGPSNIPFPGYVRPENGSAEWIADNTQKGISAGIGALTVHATAEFSRRHLQAPEEKVARLLLQAAEPWLGGQGTDWRLHRWMYSRPVASEGSSSLYLKQPAPLLVAGDGLGGPRLEGAFLSGLEAAQRLVASSD